MAFHLQRKDPLGADEDVINVPSTGVEVMDNEVPFRERTVYRPGLLLRDGSAFGMLGVLDRNVRLLLQQFDADNEDGADGQRAGQSE
ncbi:MAG: hypothetical protein ACYDAX_00015 [Desulfobacteria bacterium]